MFQRLDMKVKLYKGAFYGLTNGLCPFSWEVLEFVWHPIKAWIIIKIMNVSIDRSVIRKFSDTVTFMVFMYLFGIETQIIKYVTNRIDTLLLSLMCIPYGLPLPLQFTQPSFHTISLKRFDMWIKKIWYMARSLLA